MFFRARAEKGIARHIDASSVVDWFVLSMHIQVILDSLFAGPGFSSYRGREERKVQGLDYLRSGYLCWVPGLGHGLFTRVLKGLRRLCYWEQRSFHNFIAHPSSRFQ